MKISCKVNGRLSEIDAPPMRRLLDALREDLLLTGTKEGCGEGECGACSVIIDGAAVNSCLIPVCQAVGTEITTVEGLGPELGLDALQTAFLKYGGAQCGICTPGMLISARVLLNTNPTPSREEIKEAIAGNLCRCTGYVKIIDAIEHALAKQEL